MKCIILRLSVLFSFIILNTGCTTLMSSNDEKFNEKESQIQGPISEDLQQALALAKANKDYRLLVTSGRNMNIPGIKPSDYQRVIGLCGKKYNPNAGDVITSEEQRSARKKEINYMHQYNEQMLTICQEILIK